MYAVCSHSTQNLLVSNAGNCPSSVAKGYKTDHDLLYPFATEEGPVGTKTFAN